MATRWKNWQRSDDEASTDQNAHNMRASKSSKARTPIPSSSSEVLWAAGNRLGATFKHMKRDLAILGEDRHHADILGACAHALQMLGSHLLPGLGKKCVKNIASARPESQEFIFLLAMLASSQVLRPALVKM